MQNKVIVVAGQTGVGKTKYAEKLAKEVGGELINADSRQTYKYLDVATNKGKISPTVEIDAVGLPVYLTENEPKIHHISFVEPDNYYSAAEFQRNAALIIQDLLHRNITPIVVGGTGLYIQSLIEAEKYNLQVREASESTQMNIAKASNLLAEKYPEVWIHVNESDKKNLPHLLGILRKYQREEAAQKDNEIIKFLRSLEWDLRYVKLTKADHRIALMDRVEAMWSELIKETKQLLKTYSPQTKALQTIGYLQAIDFINGKIDAKTGMQQIFHAHWQYARRQQLWFEKFYLPKTAGWNKKEVSINKLLD